jgi:negative regulator of flagellin synthesis FlgM
MRPIDIQPTGQVRTTEKVTATKPVRPATTVANGEQDVEVVRRTLFAGKEPPVDHDRVDQIRQALAEGSYPLVPAEIADAMIAAKLTLRSSS